MALVKPRTNNKGYVVESTDSEIILFGFTLTCRPKNDKKGGERLISRPLYELAPRTGIVLAVQLSSVSLLPLFLASALLYPSLASL